MPKRTNFNTEKIKDPISRGTYKKNISDKRVETTNEFDERRINNIIDWTTFYRRNIHMFVEHYFDLRIFFVQKMWLYLMGVSDSFVAICSRGVGKTWLLAVFACAKAVLYPKSRILVCSSTKEQAGLLVSEKITELVRESPNLAREISDITTNMNKWQVDFYNGSVITVVASKDSSRGKRSTFIIYEEFRLIDKNVLDGVIRPTAYVRQASYLKYEPYKNDKRLIEQPKEVFISSAYHKGLWWYDETKANLEAMLHGENSGAIFLDYSLALLWNIKTSEAIRREKSKMDEIIATEEYDNIPWGESTNAYFKLVMFDKSRKIERSFYPQRADTYNPKKNPYGIDKQPDEIRTISLDVASKGGEANDLSVFSCFRLIPEKRGYRRQVVYMESYSGKDTPAQAMRFKQLWYDFDADYLVLDAANMGGAVYEQLSMPTYDVERDIEYPAMCIMEHVTLENPKYEDLRDTKTLSLNGLPIIYPIIADAKLNSQIAVEMRDKLQKRMIDFLVKDTDAEGYLLKNNKEFSSNMMDPDTKAWYLQSYIQTNLLVNECINLEMNPNSLTHIQLKSSTSRGRKDRYSSVSYGNYFATLLDSEILKENEDDDWEKLFNTMLFHN